MKTVRRVLYVVIDRRQDATVADHQSNIQGVEAAARACDSSLVVEPVTVFELQGLDEAALLARYAPFALFGAGSWSEWFHYGVDPAWRAALDEYMALLRTTRIPTLAVCGSHQLLGIAMNGFSAVAHMADYGPPTPISAELALTPPQLMIPTPRVGEAGTYPLAVTAHGATDPVIAPAVTGLVSASLHHSDMVTDWTGGRLLMTCDPSREVASTSATLCATRCEAQAIRWGNRPVYGVQFHPEIARFGVATEDDGGFGERLLVSFLRGAEQPSA
jgi:GMP synthase-like glutamine amidotransferase